MRLIPLCMQPAGIQQHYLAPDGLKTVLNLEIIEARVLGDDHFQEFTQPRNIPPVVANFVDQFTRGRLRCHFEGLKKRNGSP